MEVLRDPVRLTFAFGGSLLLLLVIAYGLSSDVENLAYAVLDQDQTPASRAYLQEYSSSRYFLEEPELLNKDDLEIRLATRQITMAIEIPPSFGRDLKRGGNPEVSVWIDGAETSRARPLKATSKVLMAKFIERMVRESTSPQVQNELASFELRYMYNPTFESIYAMGPTIPTMMLLLFPAILMAVSVAREKEIGTITNFYVTPTRRMEFLLGKQLPYIGIGMANFAILTIVVVFLLQVPMKGSLLTLTLRGVALRHRHHRLWTVGFQSCVEPSHSRVTGSDPIDDAHDAILGHVPASFDTGRGRSRHGNTLAGGLLSAHQRRHVHQGTHAAALVPDLIKLAIFPPVFWILCVLLLKKQEK